MALLPDMFKNRLVALFLLGALAGPAHGATFSAERGMNLDLWTTWPGEERWAEEDVLFPFPEWRRSVGPAELSRLKDAGLDFLRIPVDPSVFLSPRTEPVRERLYEEVLEAVRMVNAAGLKAILDLHLIPSHDGTLAMQGVLGDPTNFEAYLEVVRRMGRTLSREDPELVAFELMNEPGTECDAAGNADWAERLTRLFAAARASATRLTLVLTGGCGGSAEGLAALDPATIPDGNVIWTFHSYQPFLLTHQGALWAGDFIRYVTGLPYPPHALSGAELDAVLENVRATIRAEAPWSRRSGMLAYLDEQVETVRTPERLRETLEAPFGIVAEWAGRHGIRPENILLGEFGMIRQEWGDPFVMPAASRAAFARDMIGVAEEHGYGWALWGYGGAFGIVEEFDGRPAEPDMMEMLESLD